jgi:hypothetical protein
MRRVGGLLGLSLGLWGLGLSAPTTFQVSWLEWEAEVTAALWEVSGWLGLLLGGLAAWASYLGRALSVWLGTPRGWAAQVVNPRGMLGGALEPRTELDLTASTDGEDLWVFAADVFEFVTQELYLLADLVGWGAGGLGLVWLLYRGGRVLRGWVARWFK